MDFGSTNEENVHIALTQLKLDFSYQVPIRGGRGVRGGQVLDFVIYIPPQPIALYVNGRRWHSGKFGIEDTIKHADTEREGYEVMVIWEDECESIDQAKGWIGTHIL